MHFILSDEIDSGKSAFISELAHALRKEGHMVRGWLTPAHILSGRKVGHDFVALSEAREQPRLIFTRREPFERSFAWRNYHFSELAFARAHGIEPSADLFVMDEIGPLELEEYRGFATAARRAVGIAPTTLTVVRKGLEERLVERLGMSDCAIHSLSSGAELAESLRKTLSRPVHRL